MTNLLLNLVNNLTEEIHKIKWKQLDCSLKYESVKKNLIKYSILQWRIFRQDW